MKLNLYAMAILATTLFGSIEAIRISEGEEKKEQVIELKPEGGNHCVKLAQGDSQSEFCGTPLIIGDGNCCKEDERPL